MFKRRTRSLSIAKKKLIYYVKILKKLCHNKGCKLYSSCPRMCCNNILGMNTAVIWASSYIIEDLNYILLIPTTDEKTIKSLMDRNNLMLWLSYQHPKAFSKNQFSVLRNAQLYTSDLLYYINERVVEEIVATKEMFVK